MSSEKHSMSTSEYVVNPLTKRPIKVGSRTWVKLVKQGLLENSDIEDPRELADVSDYNENDIQDKINEINNDLPPSKQAVRGRGKYKGRLVVREKEFNPSQYSQYTSKLATKALKKMGVSSDESDDQLERLIESMLLEECGKPNRPQSTYRVSSKDREYEAAEDTLGVTYDDDDEEDSYEEDDEDDYYE